MNNITENETDIDVDEWEPLKRLSEDSPCDATIMENDGYLPVLLFISTILFIILMLTERSNGLTRGCNGRCGILMSVNFLENKTNRSMIVAAFTLTTLDVVEVMFEMDELAMPEILKVIYRIIKVCLLSFMYLPLFHCISVRTILRQFLGLCYVLIIVPLRILSSVTKCPYRDVPLFQLFEQVAEFVIVLSAGTFLAAKFIYRIIKIMKTKQGASPSSPTQAKDPYEVEYIKNLLRKRSSVNEVLENETKFTRRIRKYLYKNIPGFRFSLSILVSAFLGILLYVIVISSIVGLVLDIYLIFWNYVQKHRHDLNATMPNIVVVVAKILSSYSMDGQQPSPSDSLSVAVFFEMQLNCVCVSFFLSAALATFQVCSTVIYMLKGYRNNVLSLYRQELDDNVIDGVDNVELVVNAIQFAGYQVAHMIWGYVLQHVVFTLLLLLFAEIIIFPILFNYWGVIWALFSWLGPIFFVMFLSRYIQTILVRKAFLVNRGRVFGIDNRKCFFNMMFFMFFYNIFSGLVTCVLRVVKVTILSVWFFPRLDRSIFPHSFEKFDAGYKAYVCLLKLEERQNNVILLCFVQLLAECSSKSEKFADLVQQQRPLALSSTRRKSPRNRWFLAWTLIHNKSLQSERRGPKTDASSDSTEI